MTEQFESHQEMNSGGNDQTCLVKSVEFEMKKEDKNTEGNNSNKGSSLRVKIDNLPPYMNQPQLKKFLNK